LIVGILALPFVLSRPLADPLSCRSPLPELQILSSYLPDEAAFRGTIRTKRNRANHPINGRKALRRHRGPQY
jgi:hypothetical protein